MICMNNMVMIDFIIFSFSEIFTKLIKFTNLINKNLI